MIQLLIFKCKPLLVIAAVILKLGREALQEQFWVAALFMAPEVGQLTALLAVLWQRA